jgi:hypothetical protein
MEVTTQRAAQVFEKALAARPARTQGLPAHDLEKSLAARTFESLLVPVTSSATLTTDLVKGRQPAPVARPFTPEDGVKYGSATGQKPSSLEHDAPYLANGAKYKIVKTEKETAPYKVIGESYPRYHEFDAKEHTASVHPLVEAVAREGHALYTRRQAEVGAGKKIGLAEYAADARHPEHAAYEYGLLKQHLDPARDFNRLAAAKKGKAMGAMTQGAHEITMHEGIGHTINQHQTDFPSHMTEVVHGMRDQINDPDLKTKHIQNVLEKTTRGAQRQAWWARALHHLASNPESQAPGRESNAAHPKLEDFSERAYVLHTARLNPKLSFADLNAKVKPKAEDDFDASGKYRRPVLGIYKKHPANGYVLGNPTIRSSADVVRHLANTKLSPTSREIVNQHLTRFEPSHPSLTGEPPKESDALSHVRGMLTNSPKYGGTLGIVGPPPPRPAGERKP